MEITRGVMQKPLRVVVYGPEGIGKTTFASCFPRPIFIDTENSTEFLDVPRFPRPTSWVMLMEELQEVWRRDGEFETVVIDTADWAEALCKAHICSKANVNGIEGFGYGKGYVYLAEEWGKLLNVLTELRDKKGLNVVITAHAALRKFEQPDEMGSYDRWELKLEKKTAPLVKEWADMMLFANYQTLVIKDGDGKNAKSKARGGKRVMYTSHHPCWDAKNRQGLPPELPFEYAAIASCVSRRTQTQTRDQSPVIYPEDYSEQEVLNSAASEPETIIYPDPGSKLPVALTDLMAHYSVTEEQIQKVVAARGYYPANTPISNYDPNFVSGVLVGAWDQVYKMIKGE